MPPYQQQQRANNNDNDGQPEKLLTPFELMGLQQQQQQQQKAYANGHHGAAAPAAAAPANHQVEGAVEDAEVTPLTRGQMQQVKKNSYISLYCVEEKSVIASRIVDVLI